MKILFLNPLDKNNCAHCVVQPLGLMYLVSSLRNRFDHHEIKILDMKVHYLSDEEALEEVHRFSPDVVGIRALSVEAASVHALAKKIKENHPNCKIILGGPYTHGSSKSILKDSNIDFVVMGEGEETVCELIEDIEKGNIHPDISGIGYIRQNEEVYTPPRDPIQDLDSIPFPAWDHIDMESYFKTPSWNSNYSRHMAIFTSRGCPFRCAYCHNIFGKKPRLRSAENVLQEIDILYNQYGVREFKIIDDIFNLNKPRVHKICDMIVERGYDLGLCFPNGLRGDIMDTATLKKLKDAGTFMITYAVETASPRLQKLIKKNIKLDKLKTVIAETIDMGIFTEGFFMMGFPSESREEIISTADYVLSSKLHWMRMFVVNPFEGTEIAEMAVEMGINIDHDNMDFAGGYRRIPVQLSEMPVKDIKMLQLKTLVKFFLNPSRLYSAYKCTSNKKQLFFLFLTFLIKLVLPPFIREKSIRGIFITKYHFGEYWDKAKIFITKKTAA